jgi:hypothetical protein
MDLAAVSIVLGIVATPVAVVVNMLVTQATIGVRVAHLEKQVDLTTAAANTSGAVIAEKFEELREDLTEIKVSIARLSRAKGNDS